MIEPFLLRAVAVALLFAAAAGPLGAFVVWRRMAYFGEALAHSVLLGIAAGFLLGLAPAIAVLPFMLGFALLLLLLERQRLVPVDTLLAVLAHGALAGGVITVSLVGGVRTDLLGYLFGDVLAVGPSEIATVAGVALVIGGLLLVFWRPLLSATVSEELAAVEGVAVRRMRLLLVLLLALVVAAGMRVVGMLLVMALLIVPAAAARHFSRSPEAMALRASLLGCASVLLGLAGAWELDLPAGPAIALVTVTLFFLSLLAAAFGRSGRSRS